jgi:hypothetical protein
MLKLALVLIVAETGSTNNSGKVAEFLIKSLIIGVFLSAR